MKYLLWLITAFALVYLVLFSFTFMQLYTGQVPDEATVLKTFLENNGLNLLGDALAGVFAPITFLVIVTTLFVQQRQAEQTVKDMQEQNRLAKVTAKANYKLALHEKRLAVYIRLKECAFAVVTSGTIERETRQNIYATLEDAKFMFDDQVVNYIADLSEKTDEIMRVIYRETRLGDKRNRMGLTESEEVQWNQALDQRHVLEQWFYDNLTYEILEQHFTPSLRLPEDIE